MRPVIVTRTQPGADETASRLEAMGGIAPIVAPALEIEYFDLEAGWAPEPGENLIFTSANGVHAFEKAGWPRNALVVAVGPATTEAAKAAGFSTILNADGR